MRMSNEMLVEAKVNNSKKSTGTAYLLLLFLGSLGAHRFYMGKIGTGWTQLILFFLGILTLGLLWIPLGIWLLIDLVLLPSIIREHLDKARKEARLEVMALNAD